MIVVSNQQERRQLDILTDGFVAEGARIRLFINDLEPDADTVDGDYTQATFAGYSAVLLEFTAPARTDPDGNAVRLSNCIEFAGTGAAQLVYGWYMTTSDGVVVFESERFEDPPILGVDEPPLCFQLRAMLKSGDFAAVPPVEA